jgi:hypothetical protein
LPLVKPSFQPGWKAGRLADKPAWITLMDVSKATFGPPSI